MVAGQATVTAADTRRRDFRSPWDTEEIQVSVPVTQGSTRAIPGTAGTQDMVAIPRMADMAIGHGTTPVTMTITHHRWFRIADITTMSRGTTTCTRQDTGILTVIDRKPN